MLNNIPYETIKKNARDYEIMLQRDQHGCTFPELAKEFGLSVARVRDIYENTKAMQVRLYIKHIAVALGHEDDSIIRQIFCNAIKAYGDMASICTYFEKAYPNILEEYRAGEPGMPQALIKALPPCVPHLRKETIAQIVELKEKDKASFQDIAKRMDITPEKAKSAYNGVYHDKARVLLKKLTEHLEDCEEKRVIRRYYYRKYRSGKKRYEALLKDMNLPPEE